MKKLTAITIIAFIACICYSQEPEIQEINVIKVSNGTELLQAIAPNTTIELTAAEYRLPCPDPQENSDNSGDGSDSEEPVHTDYVNFDFFSGYTIRSLDNLTIIGKEKSKAHVYIRKSKGAVFGFDSCTNIRLQNLKLGHQPPAGKILRLCGDITAPVIDLRSYSKNIIIDKCDLYGTGNWGIVGYSAEDITVIDTNIYDCNIGLARLMDSKAVKFITCNFHDNTTGRYAKDNWFGFGNSSVIFDKCRITNNKFTLRPEDLTSNDYYILHGEKQYLVYMGKEYDTFGTGSVEFRNCVFSDNDFEQITDMPESVAFINSDPTSKKSAAQSALGEGPVIGQVGAVKMKSGEIIVKTPEAAGLINMGDRLYLRIGGKAVLMKASFPMQTISKCVLEQGYRGYMEKITKGMPVHRYVKEIENEAEQ